MKVWIALAIALIACESPVAQAVQVNRENRTIEVTVSEKVEAVADVAIIKFAFENQAPTREAAYQESLKASAKIVQAIRDAKLPLENLETNKLSLGRTFDENKKITLYEAEQSWQLRVSAADAAVVVDLLMKAGANRLQDVEWELSNPAEAENTGMAKALSRSREQANLMAAAMGRKAGELLYVSNSPARERFVARFWLTGALAGVKADLQLFAPKIQRDVNVQVVFALE